MNTFFFNAPPSGWATSLITAFGWTLFHALWQGFALVIPVAVLLHTLPNRPSWWRYRLALTALFGQVLVSILTFARYYKLATDSNGLATVGNESLSGRIWQLPDLATLSWQEAARLWLETHLPDLVLFWVVGVLLFGLRLLGGWSYVQRLKATATTLHAQPALTIPLTRLTVALRLQAAIQIRESMRVTVPMVVGWLKPVILWPVGLATHLSPAEVEAVLAHELAHVRRNDFVVNLLQSVVDVLYFFHPALWWLSARVREEREHCCDDLAVSVCDGAATLARALAQVEAWRLAQESVAAPALAMSLLTRRKLLVGRVRRMLGIAAPSSARPVVSTGLLAGLTLLTLLVVSVSVYAMQQQEATTTQPPKRSVKHTVKPDTSFETGDGNRLTRIIWYGRVLPQKQIAQLQRQLDRVLAGQLNLDVIPEPNRDILLTIIEVQNTIDPPSAVAKLTPVSRVEVVDSVQTPTGWVERARYTIPVEVTEVDCDTLPVAPVPPNPAQMTVPPSAVQERLQALTQKMTTLTQERQSTLDRLIKEMGSLTLKTGDYQKQLGMFSQQLGPLMKQQGALLNKLAPLQTDIQRLSGQNTAKARALLRQKEQRSNRLEAQIEQLGNQADRLNAQLEPLQTKIEPYQTRMAALADSIGLLYEPTYALAGEISKLSEQIAEDAEYRAEDAIRQAEEALRGLDLTDKVRVPRPPRPAVRARSPRPAIAPKPSVNATPTPSPTPARPRVTPTPRPATAPKF